MSDELVVLVDAQDNELGTAPKMRAHLESQLHRAVSAVVYDRAGRMLLQRRALGKYHSGGLWSNACCTHPRPGEPPDEAARRRLREEMGLRTKLDHAFTFIYRAELEAGLVEHELDHVFVGIDDQDPVPDPLEVMEWRWIDPDALRRELDEGGDRFTAWFRILAPRLSTWRESLR